MTKVLAIGDTHGRLNWKQLVSREAMMFDKLIFLGDYFDSREGINNNEQVKNFKDIVQLKRNYPEKIELLFGNHDFHYISSEAYSLYDPKLRDKIEPLLKELLEEGVLKLCYHHNGFLFSHAGISTEWLDRWNYDYSDIDNMVDSINDMMKTEDIHTHLSFGMNTPEQRWPSTTGDDTTQSPIWIRPLSLSRSKLPDVTHVFGHTQVTELQEIKNMIASDILGTKSQCIMIQDGSWEVKNI